MPITVKQYEIVVTLEGSGQDAQIVYSAPPGQPPLGSTNASLSVTDLTPGDLVIIVWSPGPNTLITSIRGLPSNVRVEGPDENGAWFASYRASAVKSAWSYCASAKHSTTGAKVHSEDPEIDNTPPPLPPGA